jgi:general secretion pathway protein H
VGSLSQLIANPSARARFRSSARGFTLLELLVVLVIVGLTLGFVSVNMMQSTEQALQSEAQRIALLLQLARDEAIVRNRPIAFEADGERYRFLMRENNTWKSLAQEDLLREREFSRAPVAMSISPANVAESNPLRIVFGREPVDKPFVLTMSTGDASVVIRADGIGHFNVE